MIEDKKAHEIYLVMEYVAKGALLSKTYWASENFKAVACGPTRINPEKAKKYFRQLVEAVYFCNFS